MKTKSIFQLLFLFLYLGCSPDDSVAPSQKFQGSLFVTVRDTDGKPVSGATLVMDDQTAITDDDGTYYFTQVTLTGDDYLQVEKSGYFKGSRRFNTKESSTQFLQVTLMYQEEIGNFNAASSASISIDSKSKLTFPDHSVTRADGSSYSGNVRVMASPIYSDDPQMSDKMPGALTAIDETGAKVVLGSFGMLAVELQADNGDVLEIASGKTVEVQFGIPNTQLGQAPPTIPLWYFDEAKGYWVQEGEATKQGNVYVAQLPHFSFWNWDVVYELVNWEASYVYPGGTAAQNAEICMTIKSINTQRCTKTDANGQVYGPVPANELLELIVRNDCGNIIYADEIGPFSDDVKMERTTLDITQYDYATISGTALKCDGSPLTSGMVRVRTTLNNFLFPIQDAAGHFEGGYVYCTGDVVTLYMYDVSNSLVSLPHTVSFDRSLNVGSLYACEQLDEYLHYKIKGFSPEYVYYLPDLSYTGHSTKINSIDSIGVKGRFGFSIDGGTTGQYIGYAAHGNQINLPNGQIAYILNMTVDVAEFGGAGQYVRGTFSGKINTGNNGAGGPGKSDFSGSFSVLNE